MNIDRRYVSCKKDLTFIFFTSICVFLFFLWVSDVML